MTQGTGPLNGIRVIDLGRHQAGPRCAQILARLGAEVIKIERIGGEETRYHGPWVRKQSAYWVQYNSGKKSVSMDLRKACFPCSLRRSMLRLFLPLLYCTQYALCLRTHGA